MDLYSYRKKVAEGDTPDVFTYDNLPKPLRIQIIHIWREAIGRYFVYPEIHFEEEVQNNEAWVFIHNEFSKDLGVLNLDRERNFDSRCENFFFKLQFSGSRS